MLGAKSKLSLAKQGLILVSMMIGIELMFVGILFLQVLQTEREVEREKDLKAIAVEIQHLGRALIESKNELRNYVATRKDDYWRQYLTLSTDLHSTVSDLKRSLEPYKTAKELIAQIDSEARFCSDWMNGAKSKIDGMDTQASLALLNSPTEPVVLAYHRLVEKILLLGQDMEKRLAASPEEQRKIREIIRSLLIVGLIVNVGFAAVLQLFFARGITSRLTVMVDNTNRLKRGQPLNPKIAGADEIAMLDQSFHQMSDELAEAQRARQAFVAMISHDLRSPLTTVQAFLYMLGNGVLGDVSQPIVDRSSKVEMSVTRLIRLINDLLDLEKLEAGKMALDRRQVDVFELVDKAIEAVAADAAQNAVNIQKSGAAMSVLADPDRLVQVLVNLLSNACKFSPNKGLVTVEVERKPGSSDVEFRVSDQGPGIAKRHQDLIFERYRQVSVEDATKRGGTGLGLPICKLIVEQHGGRIGVTSEEGKGACFWFVLTGASALPASVDP
jgi:signal transduction histidine kinase